MAELYRLTAVKKIYGDRVALNIASLTVEGGEILAIVGPSGAGKSTLLRLLNFLEPPSSGQLWFAGEAAPVQPPLTLLRRVTTVFQRPLLLNRSVRGNVAYGLQLRGERGEGQVEAALNRVGLTDFADRPARALSGGEMQRVALARALVLNPDVLLLDEPTANLDPYNVGLIETIVRNQNETQQTTVVMVTHNIFQARRLAHRTGLLLNGELVELASTADFFERPRDPRAAAFVKGEMAY